MVTFWATFCLSNSIHFHLNKVGFVAGALSFKSGFMLMFCTFKLGFDVDSLALWASQLFWLLLQKCGLIFSQSSGHPVLG